MRNTIKLGFVTGIVSALGSQLPWLLFLFV